MAMVAPVPDLPGQELVFGRDRKARMPLLRRGVTTLVFAGLAAAAAAWFGPPMLVIAGLLGLGAVGCAAAYVWEGTFRTVLRPDGIHIRRYARRFIPWSDVACFRVRRHGQLDSAPGDPRTEHTDQPRALQMGQRNMPEWDRPPDENRRRPSGHVTVEVVRANGRRLLLPAPVVSGPEGDYQFNDKVRQLEQWRQHYAGALSASARFIDPRR
jgi:hypothetical protein